MVLSTFIYFAKTNLNIFLIYSFWYLLLSEVSQIKPCRYRLAIEFGFDYML